MRVQCSRQQQAYPMLLENKRNSQNNTERKLCDDSIKVFIQASDILNQLSLSDRSEDGPVT